MAAEVRLDCLFTSSNNEEMTPQFFRVRLWGQDNLIDQLLEHYDEDLRSELPLKRIWMAAAKVE